MLRHLREGEDGPTPVILLTAKGEQEDKLAGLRNGADDYVVKPFSPSELVARVDAVLRRVNPPGRRRRAAALRRRCEIDGRARRVTLDGEEVQLSQREFDLLEFFASQPGRGRSRATS